MAKVGDSTKRPRILGGKKRKKERKKTAAKGMACSTSIASGCVAITRRVLTVFHAVRCLTASTGARQYSDHDGKVCCQETNQSRQFHVTALQGPARTTGVLPGQDWPVHPYRQHYKQTFILHLNWRKTVQYKLRSVERGICPIAALNHMLRGSGSTVVTMTSKVNGKTEI